MSREELLVLVNRIISVDGDEEEIAEMVELFERNVPHPAPSDLIYYEDLSSEEIVEKALAYKPIAL